MKSLIKSAITGALAAIALASVSHANLIINGDFEASDFTGWTGSGAGLNGSGTIGTFVTTFPSQTGKYSAYLGSIGLTKSLSQTFATAVGQTYEVSFRFYGLNVPPQELDVLFGAPTAIPDLAGLSSYFGMTDLLTLGGPLYHEAFSLPQDHVWQTYDFLVQATSVLSQLTFVSRQDTSFDNLDDVSVTAFTAVVPPPSDTSAVPEPSTYGIFGAMALAGLTALRRRRELSGVKHLA